MSYLVKLLKSLQTPVTAEPSDLITDVLERMIEHKYSQLPVVDRASKKFYLITSESIMQAYVDFGVNIKTTKLRVSDALVKVNHLYFEDDDLFVLLQGVRDNGAALIVDENQELRHIVTSYDMAEFFRQWAESLSRRHRNMHQWVMDAKYSLRWVMGNEPIQGDKRAPKAS